MQTAQHSLKSTRGWMKNMELQLTSRAQRLLELLMVIPPRFEAAESLMKEHNLSPDEVTRVGNIYAEKCFLDFGDYLAETYPEYRLSEMPIPDGPVPVHSTYIYEVVELLLQFGLDPNAIYEEPYSYLNIMDSLKHIDNGYVAADTMGLLLEHGGDPNLSLDGETLFEMVDFDVWFGSVEQEMRWRYDSWVHLWMVLVAYGGEISGKGSMVETFKEYTTDTTNVMFDLSKLRNHRDYYYGLTWENGDPCINIYDKKTLWKVASA